ncbi:hypothetical protein J2S43_007836 [Catenuloplanes nepalensis]|uniref:Uncharacterized protein n=1 Tax=Catenuloplanes nepalensis TaxID=587533 RepID=A0ABT9N6L1_9ACTN|nr:hypothetical protein [Catenuloplanes nepalensis]MDP9799324.1 hypothetical protein [Catenuloplanes nepalensis]
MVRPKWTGSEEQLRALSEAVEARRSASDAEEASWLKMQAARVAGVPDELLCEQTNTSRSKLNRKLGARPTQSRPQRQA